jgi:YihY family inner membrane protein
MSQATESIDRLRALAERIIERLGGHPGVVRLQAVFDAYDLGGGGLVAAGLAYTSLLALLPGMLLGVTIIGYLVRDPADQEKVVAFIGQVVPPLEDIARAAFEQVSTGAVPTSIVAILGLLWGATRFYANLDTAFSRIFRGASRRNPIVQTVRGVILVGILVIVPVLVLAVGSAATWLTEHAPNGVAVTDFEGTLFDLSSPIGTLVMFTFAVAMCYRFVPTQRIGWRSLALPAVLVGLVLAVFTQIYVFIAPRLVGWAALYGAFVALFALLAWLSVGFNVLLLGAAWTDVRGRYGPWFDRPATGADAAETAAGRDETSPATTVPAERTTGDERAG